MTNLPDKTRRRFLQTGLSALACCGLSAPALAGWVLPTDSTLTRGLVLRAADSNEASYVAYWRDRACDRDAWARINHMMRDADSGEAGIVDLRLIDLLHDLQNRLGGAAIEILSGYRSRAAADNPHRFGRAADIRMTGIPLPHMHRAALAIGKGGVGYYPDAPFVHIDVARDYMNGISRAL